MSLNLPRVDWVLSKQMHTCQVFAIPDGAFPCILMKLNLLQRVSRYDGKAAALGYQDSTIASSEIISVYRYIHFFAKKKLPACKLSETSHM